MLFCRSSCIYGDVPVDKAHRVLVIIKAERCHRRPLKSSFIALPHHDPWTTPLPLVVSIGIPSNEGLLQCGTRGRVRSANRGDVDTDGVRRFPTRNDNLCATSTDHAFTMDFDAVRQCCGRVFSPKPQHDDIRGQVNMANGGEDPVRRILARRRRMHCTSSTPYRLISTSVSRKRRRKG